jgi:hypothetical protein
MGKRNKVCLKEATTTGAEAPITRGRLGRKPSYNPSDVDEKKSSPVFVIEGKQ